MRLRTLVLPLAVLGMGWRLRALPPPAPSYRKAVHLMENYAEKSPEQRKNISSLLYSVEMSKLGVPATDKGTFCVWLYVKAMHFQETLLALQHENSIDIAGSFSFYAY